MNPFLITNTPLLKLKAVILLLMVVVVGYICESKDYYNCSSSSPVRPVTFYGTTDYRGLGVVKATKGGRRFNVVINAEDKSQSTMYMITVKDTFWFYLYHRQTKTFICYQPNNRNGKYKLSARRKPRPRDCVFAEYPVNYTNFEMRLVPCECSTNCTVDESNARQGPIQCTNVFKSKKKKKTEAVFMRITVGDCDKAMSDLCEDIHVTRHEHIMQNTSIYCPEKRTW